jgi:hypothetical protein
MKTVFALTVGIVVLAVAAFAADAPPYLTAHPEPGNPGGGGGHGGSDAVLVDNLCTSAAQIMNGLTGAVATYNAWLAFDYTPANDVKVNKLWYHYIYWQTPKKDSINFRLYQGSTPGGSIVRTWVVPTSSYNEVSTGWTKWGRVVYRAEMTIPDQNLTAKTKYWFAYQSAATVQANAIYWAVRSQLVEATQVYWYLNGRWGTCSSQGGGGAYEQSYKIEGVLSGVAPTSFGKVKALFK